MMASMAREGWRQGEGEGEGRRRCGEKRNSMKAVMVAAMFLAITARTSAFSVSQDSSSSMKLRCAFTAPAASSGLQAAGQRKAVCLRQKNTRDDGASEEEVQKAIEYYKDLMRTNNRGKGYWMDDFFPFMNMVRNIQQGIKRNFVQKSGEDYLKEAASEGLLDISSSPFAPISSLPDMPAAKAEVEQKEPELKQEVAKSEPKDDEDLAELKKKMEEAKKKKKQKK
uniref:Uncharacterized protein n=1 Tax=Hanusia phi TaxID=3032 RepID=A0A7S0HWE8_9CRYP|mmetsp:Transcript_5/g.22  ORF Transcript_5/g.22 Transcript_5/m.22 type:complete len:225 (+) Transcript_5:3-677(+)